MVATRSRFRFGLKLLLAFIAITCVLLSRHYPRVHYSVTVDCVPKGGHALTYAKLAKCKAVLRRVYEAHPEFYQGPSADDAIELLRNTFDSYVTDKQMVKLESHGKPKDIEALTAVVDAVSKELVEFLSESEQNPRTVRLSPSTTYGL